MQNKQGNAPELSERLDFMELGGEASKSIGSITKRVEAHLPEALDRFYQKVSSVPATAGFFRNEDHMDTAKRKQLDHWSAIANGQFDEDYFEGSKTVGCVHARIGLEPRWYIGGYAEIVHHVVAAVVADELRNAGRKGGLFSRKSGPDALSPDEFGEALGNLIRGALLDMDIAVSTYFEKVVEETEKLNAEIQTVISKAEEGDFTGRSETGTTNPALAELERGINNLMQLVGSGVGEAASVMSDLADLDLTRRMEGSYKGAFANLQRDTNAVAEKLTEVIGQLRSSSTLLKTATAEILAGTNDLSERTTKQAATIEETAATMEQLAQTVSQNADRAEEANGQSRTVSDTADRGGQVMGEATEAMQRITSSSSKISNIIGMIDDIAFQTNLLALNASVEAARAGEAGKGFAVVAVEVRRLAQSAAEASSEVKVLIEQSAEEVDGGSKLVQSVAEQLSAIVEAARDNSALMERIVNESRQQAASINEVNAAVRQMDEMTQHNAALVEETNAAIEQTENQANELDRIVEVFRLGGSASGPLRTRGSNRSTVGQPLASRSSAPISGNTALDMDWEEF